MDQFISCWGTVWVRVYLQSSNSEMACILQLTLDLWLFRTTCYSDIMMLYLRVSLKYPTDSLADEQIGHLHSLVALKAFTSAIKIKSREFVLNDSLMFSLRNSRQTASTTKCLIKWEWNYILWGLYGIWLFGSDSVATYCISSLYF